MKNKLLLLSFGLLMTTQMIFSQVPSFVPSNGLVGYWGFSGNANDQSGNGNNGSVNGAILTTDRFGNSNSAYSFDGISNYIQTNYQGVLGNNFRTISFWAKSNSTSEMAAFSYGASSGTGNRFDGYFNFNGLGCTVNIAGGAVTYSTPSSVNDNNWHNYIYVVDQINSQAISVKIYQDGNLLTTAINTYNPNTPINTVNEIGLRFGKTTYSGIPSNFNGKIDDIGFWNRALNQQEITNMYNGVNYSDTCNAVSGSLVNGLVGYWPFCGNANDQSGNGLNGVVNGATLTADRFGNNNSSYLFNNNSRIKINYNNSLNSTIGAISAWIKVNSLPSDNDPQDLIFGKGWGYPQLIIRNNGKIYLEVMNSQSTATFIESSSTITIGNWCHIFGFYSSNNFKLYINGVLDNSITPLPTPSFYSYCNSEYWIGGFNHLNSCIPDDNTQSFDGLIDDIGVWNRALTPQEITQLYNQNQCFTNTTVTDTLIINVGQLSYTNPVTYANNITIYPNPANTQVNISFNNISDLTDGNINIINSLGQQVATTPITLSGTNTTMDLNSWGGTGLYFVQILNAQGIVVDVKKIILQ